MTDYVLVLGAWHGSWCWARVRHLLAAEAYKHTMISRVPFPNCRSGAIGLAIAGNPEHDGHLSPWQEPG
jgi:hypothetical protein